MDASKHAVVFLVLPYSPSAPLAHRMSLFFFLFVSIGKVGRGAKSLVLPYAMVVHIVIVSTYALLPTLAL